MAGTILSVLVAAYRAGNRQPRGRVVENLKWLAFQASQKKVKGLPAGGTACRVNSYWTEKDYRDLLAETTERFRRAMNAVREARGLPTTKKA